MPKIKLNENGRIDVFTLWAEKDLIRQLPGSLYDGDRRLWTVPLTWTSLVQLRGLFGDTLDSDPSVAAWGWREYETRVKPALDLRDAIVAEGPDAFRPYQLADIQFMLTAGDCVLANEPGTGKTISSLTAVRCRGDEGLPLLVVCPNSVKDHWARHFPRWFPEATPYVIRGGAAARRKLLDAASEDPSAAIIINYEALKLHTRLMRYGSVRLARCAACGKIDEETTAVSPSRCEVHLKELNHMTIRTVIFDELHYVKDPKSKQSRACWWVAQQPEVTRRWGLTGTPIGNHVGDLWSVMRTVHAPEYPTKTEFTDRYALWVWNEYGSMSISDVRPDTKEELFKFLDPRLRRITKKRVLPQLPPKVFAYREAEMNPKQAKMYRELEKQMYTRTPDGRLFTVTTNLTNHLRMLQLASSSVEVITTIDENGEPHDDIRLVEPSSKLDVLDELLVDFEGQQVVVSALSRQLIELAAARLTKRGERFGLITGRIGEQDRRVNLDDFQAGRTRVLLFTIKAGGVGVDMTAAGTMIRLQRSYSMIDNVQGLGRIDRIGAEHHETLHIVDVIAPDTVEVEQLDKIREKEDRLETIARDNLPHDDEYVAIMSSSLLPPLWEENP